MYKHTAVNKKKKLKGAEFSGYESLATRIFESAEKDKKAMKTKLKKNSRKPVRKYASASFKKRSWKTKKPTVNNQSKEEEFYSDLDNSLQKGILNLTDVKPKDPLRFLAAYFTAECENELGRILNQFDSVTIFHYITEERIEKTYNFLITDECQLIQGATFNNFLKKLLMYFQAPLELRKAMLEHLHQETSYKMNYEEFKRSMLTVLLYKQYFEELYCTFKKIPSETEAAPAEQCKELIHFASDCLKNIDRPRKYPELNISRFHDHIKETNVEQKFQQLSLKDTTCEVWLIQDFFKEAKEVFFKQIEYINILTFEDHIIQSKECDYFESQSVRESATNFEKDFPEMKPDNGKNKDDEMKSTLKEDSEKTDLEEQDVRDDDDIWAEYYYEKYYNI